MAYADVDDIYLNNIVKSAGSDLQEFPIMIFTLLLC